MESGSGRHYLSGKTLHPALGTMTKFVKWRGLGDHYAVCKKADSVLLDSIIAAEAFSPRVLQCEASNNVEVVTSSLRDGMLAHAFSVMAAAHERLTTHPPRLAVKLPQVAAVPSQKDAIWQISLWRVSQIWYGPLSKESRRMFEHITANLNELASTDPAATESLVVALCYGMCVRECVAAGGDFTLFAPTSERRYLNNDSPLLNDPLAAYCLLESAHGTIPYMHLTKHLRHDTKFSIHMVALAGDDALSLVPDDVYSYPNAARAILLVRKLHYANNPQRTPWLRLLATEPALVFGRGRLDLVGVDQWRAQG